MKWRAPHRPRKSRPMFLSYLSTSVQSRRALELPALELEPRPPANVHLLLRDKASWVEPQIGSNDDCFDGYPELSIEDWHKKHGVWIA